MKENEFSDYIAKAVDKAISTFIKKNIKIDKLIMVQQLNLASLNLKKMAILLEEEYKKSISFQEEK